MEGGIGYGLGAVLHNAVTLTDGRVDQSNFHDYLPLRINEMPQVEVHIVESAEPPTGVGEPGVPPIGPAVANAVYKATGRRIRALPFALHGLSAATTPAQPRLPPEAGRVSGRERGGQYGVDL